MDDNKLILSQDGSHTVHSTQFGVSYHSKYGSIQETETVFIKSGLEYQIQQSKSPISILEMGFGTGLNALMTLTHRYSTDTIIDYHTIEAYPISLNQAYKLNYPEVLNISASQKEQFYAMHEASSNKKFFLNDSFSFTKYITKLEDFASLEVFDIIYFDAFAPNAQEHLWSQSMMEKMYSLTKEGGVLTTYCAKGVFKRALKAAGFTVQGLPGPIGKREITRGVRLS